MSETAQLVLHVAAPPTRLAARLKRHLGRIGFEMLRPGTPAPADGLELVLHRAGARDTWIFPCPAEGLPATLGQVLSQELGARVTTVVQAGEVCAYEACERGKVVETLAVQGSTIVEDGGSPYAAAVRGGAELRGCLIGDGLALLDLCLEDARSRAQSVVITFAPRSRSGETIEIDPLVTCPECGEPTRRRQGRHGDFFSCVRFPDCRGTRSLKEAEALRARQ